MSRITEYEFQLPIRTEGKLRAFVEKALGIRIPNVKVCEEHSTPWEAFCAGYFARDSIIVWEGSRGLAGKSLLLAALGLSEAITLECDVNLLGGSGEQSRNVQRYITNFLSRDSIPRYEGGMPILTDDPNKYEIRLTKGQTIKSLLCSATSIRGGHPQRLKIDEVDEVALDMFEAALGQTMDRNGVPAQTVLSSTHQHPDGTFTEVKKRAQERGWKYFPWCYRETLEPHGWLSPTMIEKKKREMSAAAWRSEVELQEPNPEDRAIFPEFVEKCFNNDHEWLKQAISNDGRPPPGGLSLKDISARGFEDRDGEYIEIEAPVPEGEYAHGADWGRKVDFSAIVTLRTDVKPARIVAYRRGQRRPWPTLYGWLDLQIERYGQIIARAAHDGTGIGDVVQGGLKHDALGVVLSGVIRAEIFNAWIVAIESMQVEGPRIKTMYTEHKYVGRGIFGGNEHPPDTFVAGALAWYAKDQKRGSWRPL